MASLQAHDPVTVISRGLHGIGPTAAWVIETRNGLVTVRKGATWSDTVPLAIFDHEGIDWIRGHHPADALEVIALEAAHALRSKRGTLG